MKQPQRTGFAVNAITDDMHGCGIKSTKRNTLTETEEATKQKQFCLITNTAQSKMIWQKNTVCRDSESVTLSKGIKKVVDNLYYRAYNDNKNNAWEGVKMNIDEAVALWERYQRNILNRSENTIKNYALDVFQYAKHLGLETVESTKQDAENYAQWLADEGMAATSRARKISSVQMFYKWLEENDYIKVNPVKSLAKPKIPQKKVLAMSAQEIKDVVNAAKSENQNKDYFRNLTMISLLFSTGLRRNEIVNVRLCDLSLQDNSLLVQMGKGNKQRMVYFNDTTKALLREYLASHREMYNYAKNSEYLFISQKAEKLDVSSVNRIVNKMLESSGLKEKGFTLHSTRKAFATALYEATKDIATVQSLLGHASPQTTMRYVGVDEDSKRNAAQLINF